MVEWLVDPKKSLWENLQDLHERLKKLKKKRERLLKLIEEEKKKRAENKPKEDTSLQLRKKRKRHWYEAYRWMFTSEGRLVIGGKDARTNEIVVRRYLEEGDLFFHADVVGAPSVILKDGKNATEEEIEEAAIFAASFSRAWKMGLHRVPVFYVEASQVSLAPPSGEYRPKGGVIVKGKRNWLEVPLGLYLGFDGERVFVSTKKRSGVIYQLLPGREDKNKVAKRIIDELNLDRDRINDVLNLLPPGGIELRKVV